MHIKSVANGRYIYFDISSSLERFVQIYSTFIKKNDITLNINIDGFVRVLQANFGLLWNQ